MGRENIQKDVDAYWQKGCVIVSGVFSEEEINRLHHLIFYLSQKFIIKESGLEKSKDNYLSPKFDRKLIELRESEPKKFSALYDCIQNSSELIQLMINSKMKKLAAAILHEKSEWLACSGIMLRMDTPQDRRNTIDWHQDRGYYHQNFNGDHGIVVSVALSDSNEKMGALMVCKNSHNEGFIKPEAKLKEKVDVTEQRIIPKTLVDKYEQESLSLKKGDVLFMHMNTFHCSGFNSSNRVRYSALIRYHRMMKKDYVPFFAYDQFNQYMLEKSITQSR